MRAAVVELVLVVVERGLSKPQLREDDVLCGVQADVAAVVQLLGGHGERVGLQAKAAHRAADVILYPAQEVVARIARSLLELDHHVAVVPVDGLVEVTGLVDLAHELGDDLAARTALVARIPAHDAAPLVVHALDLGDEPGVVVLDLNLGVDAQEQRPRGLGYRGPVRAARRLAGRRGEGGSASGENGCTFMRYADTRISAGVCSDFGSYRTVCLGFPIEVLEDRGQIGRIISTSLEFFKTRSGYGQEQGK